MKYQNYGKQLETPETVETNTPAQDRSPFCILDIVKEILQHLQLLNTFLVGNHCAIFRTATIFKNTNQYYRKNI